MDSVLGRSAPMRHLFGLIARVAPTEATVLLSGESGVGKELVAECIHERSPRARGPLVAVNCGSIPAKALKYSSPSTSNLTRSACAARQQFSPGRSRLMAVGRRQARSDCGQRPPADRYSGSTRGRRASMSLMRDWLEG